MADVYIPTYAILLTILIVAKIVFWIVYWSCIRPRRLQRLAERQQQQQLMIQQQLAYQQQQQQFQSQYPQVQAFNYSSVYSVPSPPPGPTPFDSRIDLPPAYDSAVNTNDQSHPK